MVQWLGLHPSTAGGVDSIPGWGAKLPYATRCSQQQQKQHTNKIQVNYTDVSYQYFVTFLVAQLVKNPLAMQEAPV